MTSTHPLCLLTDFYELISTVSVIFKRYDNDRYIIQWSRRKTTSADC